MPAGLDDQSDVATNYGSPAATRSLKRQEIGFPLQPTERECGSAETWIQASDAGVNSVVLSHQFVIIGYCNRMKLKQQLNTVLKRGML